MTQSVIDQKTAVPPRPPFWLTLSIPAGNLLQLAGLLLGALILYGDAHLAAPAALRVVLMLLGWFLIYIGCHSLGHYLVGRLVGIRFSKYGVRGTDHPENYSGVTRQMMSAMPTFSAITEKDSMRKASPVARALMFAAGETSTAVCSIASAWYCWRAGIPGGLIWLIVMVVFNAFSTVATARFPRGDYAKALKALRTPRSSST
jgi:hypothetical protein